MLRFYLKSMLQILCNLYPFLKTMSMKLWNCLWFDNGKSNLTFLTFFFNFQIMHWRMPPFWVLQSNLPAKLWGNKVCILPFYILVICLKNLQIHKRYYWFTLIYFVFWHHYTSAQQKLLVNDTLWLFACVSRLI